MCQLVIVIVMITIYAISNSVVMITVAHVITTALVNSMLNLRLEVGFTVVHIHSRLCVIILLVV